VLRADLEGLGARVEIRAGDVSDAGFVDALVSELQAGNGLTGVVHTAGVLRDAVFENIDRDDVSEVFSGKVGGALNLDRATRDLPLKAFVLFSSAAGLMGTAGQGAYAAANSVLDALAAERRTAGLHALSLAWGLWEEESSLTSDLDRSRIARLGVLPMTTERALDAFDKSLRSSATLTVPIEHIADGQSLLKNSMNTSPLLKGIRGAGQTTGNGQAAASRKRDDASWWLNVPAHELSSSVALYLRTRIAAVVEASDVNTIQDDMTFSELGFDSLTAVELRNHIATTFGLRLSPTTIFDYPTVSSLIDYVFNLVRDLRKDQDDPTRKMSRFVTDIGNLVDSDASQIDARAEFAATLEGIARRLREESPHEHSDQVYSDELDDEQLLEYLGGRFGEE
jgi:acyl carrier protein